MNERDEPGPASEIEAHPGDDEARLVGIAQWRSRRGTLELDLILVPFAEERLPLLDGATRAAYLALLEIDDWDIFDWIQGKAEAPASHRAIVGAIREFHASRHA